MNENDNTEEKVIFDILIQTAGEDFILNIWWNRDFMLSLHQIYLFMKQKKREMMMQELGKYSLDMSKLIFGGVILAGVMNLGVNEWILFGFGGSLVVLLAVIGFVFYSKSR